MNKESKKNYKAREMILKAMAHSSRLLILDTLSKGEKCVCEFESLIEGDQSTISKHLAVLRNVGLIEAEKRGLNVYYKLRCPCVIEYMECIEKVINKNSKELW